MVRRQMSRLLAVGALLTGFLAVSAVPAFALVELPSLAEEGLPVELPAEVNLNNLLP